MRGIKREYEKERQREDLFTMYGKEGGASVIWLRQRNKLFKGKGRGPDIETLKKNFDHIIIDSPLGTTNRRKPKNNETAPVGRRNGKPQQRNSLTNAQSRTVRKGGRANAVIPPICDGNEFESSA